MSLHGFSLPNDNRDNISDKEIHDTKKPPAAKEKIVRPSEPFPLISNSIDVAENMATKSMATKSFAFSKHDQKEVFQDIAVMIRDMETEKDRMMLLSVQNAVLLDELAMAGADGV